MRLLFIKLKHIGDSLLLTPTLVAARARYPQATIWVVVRRGCEGILAGCPAIDRILTSAAPEARNRPALSWLVDLRLIRDLRRQAFDYAFELTDGDRGRFVAWLSGARSRCTNIALEPLSAWWKPKFNALSAYGWMTGHRVEKDFYTVNDFLPLGATIPPLAFARERTEPWPPGGAVQDFAVMHPGTRWVRKRWELAKWIELGRCLLTQMPHLVISVGPDAGEVALAEAIAGELGPAALSTRGALSWAQLAGLLYRARIFVGVDTAAMHLAAACQCPTVALFGPSVLDQWRPWRVPHRAVVPAECPAADEVAEDRGFADAIALRDVWVACQELLPAGRGRD
jgi:heptosyltransferase-3